MPRPVMLYNPAPRMRDMYKGKLLTLPKQCMSLQEMFRRFIRREPIGVAERQGVYIEGEYDLEKVAQMDQVDKDELLDHVRSDATAKKGKAEFAYAEHLKKEDEKRIAEEAARLAALTPPKPAGP